jgi:hypothetical protein
LAAFRDQTDAEGVCGELAGEEGGSRPPAFRDIKRNAPNCGGDSRGIPPVGDWIQSNAVAILALPDSDRLSLARWMRPEFDWLRRIC